MKFDELLEIIRTLAKSQGFYSRLLDALVDASPNQIKKVKKVWESKDFKDEVDFILYLEGED